jgi:hypothetical protein
MTANVEIHRSGRSTRPYFESGWSGVENLRGEAIALFQSLSRRPAIRARKVLGAAADNG